MSHITMVTGPTGSGKSTLISLVNRYLSCDQKKMAILDTSACIEKSRRRMTAAGTELLKLRRAQDSGFLLPGDLVVQSVLENLEWLGDELGRPPFHVFLAGSPRTTEESQAWLGLPASMGIEFRVLLIECTREEVLAGINVRKGNGVQRKDDEAGSLKTKWDEYQGQTIPALKLFNLGILSRTWRGLPLLERVHNLVNAAAVPEHVRRNWFVQLHNNTHGIHSAIERVESGLGLEEEPRVPDPLSRHHPPGSLFRPHGYTPMVLRASA